MSILSVSEAARKISAEKGVVVPPQLISLLFYRRKLDDLRCPIIGRARMIPVEYLPVVEAALREVGLLPALPADDIPSANGQE